MIRIIEDNREALERLCKNYHVRRLDLFGSAANGEFDPERSDLDFLVEFEELGEGQYADAYFGLLLELKKLFQREVDLVMLSAVDNPYLRESIMKSRTLLYAA